MTQKLDLKEIRDQLVEIETRLSRRLKEISTANHDEAADDGAAGLGNLFDRWKRNRTAESQVVEQLEKVQAALSRIDIGTYGNCTNCGSEINPERLEALPYADLCIRCQRKQETTLV